MVGWIKSVREIANAIQVNPLCWTWSWLHLSQHLARKDLKILKIPNSPSKEVTKKIVPRSCMPLFKGNSTLIVNNKFSIAIIMLSFGKCSVATKISRCAFSNSDFFICFQQILEVNDILNCSENIHCRICEWPWLPHRTTQGCYSYFDSIWKAVNANW